jgi:hypothetical protein
MPGPSGHSGNLHVWIHEVADVADGDQQVFEIQLPFTH